MTDGREVVVKVRRPGVLEQAKVDLGSPALDGRLSRASIGKVLREVGVAGERPATPDA